MSQPLSRRIGTAVRTGYILALLARLPAGMPVAIAQQAPKCDEGQVIGATPAQNGRIYLCSSVARFVPELNDRLARLEKMAERRDRLSQ